MSILNEIKGKLLGKSLLIKAGVVKSVENEQEGEELVRLDKFDIDNYKELQKLQDEFDTLLKEHRALTAKLNAKGYHLKAANTVWWDFMASNNDKLKDVLKKDGAHVDTVNMIIRKGLFHRYKVVTESK